MLALPCNCVEQLRTARVRLVRVRFRARGLEVPYWLTGSRRLGCVDGLGRVCGEWIPKFVDL